MDKLVVALGPAFAAGFAVQQLLELLNPLVIKIIGTADKKLLHHGESLRPSMIVKSIEPPRHQGTKGKNKGSKIFAHVY